jgi:branched-chain amino acid transport system ATP-binding protein
MTILLVEQNARAALELADRAYVMESGRVALEGTTAQLAADERVRTVYLGRKGQGTRDQGLEGRGNLSLAPCP